MIFIRLMILYRISHLHLRRFLNTSPEFISLICVIVIYHLILWFQCKRLNRCMQNPMGRKTYDGIIAIDTNVLVSAIKILDNSVYADGQTFTTDNDPHCDCPQVIYALENSISRPLNYVNTTRKSLLGDLLTAIMVKSLNSSPKKYWGPLFQSMITRLKQERYSL